MNAPDFPGYEQMVTGVYRKTIDDSVDEVIVLLRSYIPTKEEVLAHLLAEAKKVPVTTDYDEAFVKRLERANKHTQAILYALPINVLQGLQEQEADCMEYINKFLPDPREESEGHDWYINISCGNIPPTLCHEHAPKYVAALPGLREPYGVRWFTKIYLKELIPSANVQEQNFITHGPFEMKEILTTLGNIFSHYTKPEHVLTLHDVSAETIQLPATWPLKRILLAAYAHSEYLFSQEFGTIN